ncbi:hypothetical protein [Actinoallomurus iriomotensis]|uniref:Polymorphic outer membrane protein n=1 Tax=Actinoallomurus iriomotensis TaxID=478107 RepID=A0A9W6RAD5_9ACTN|nr:hypothetical protein [Actinoallomurus iriomotensis]GLY71969.1 hypothetical protein Airi01_002360 [Actinoallomurus iriomotensis]
MGSFTRSTSGAGIAVLTGGMVVAAIPAPATAAARVVRVPCSATALSAAMTAANASASAPLSLAPRCVYDITTPATAATALPVITRDVTLLGGPGTTIRRAPSAAARFRVLEVAAGASLRMAGVSVLNGATSGLGGGVQNAGRLVLSRVTLAGNTAANGGAIANLAGGRATVSRSVLKANTTTSVGGGGILNAGTATIFASALLSNTAPINGGGVNTQPSGTTWLIRTAVEHNTSGSLGGGLSNLGHTTLNQAVVRFNQGSAGGGLASANTKVLISRSVVRDNTPGNCSPVNTIAGCTG